MDFTILPNAKKCLDTIFKEMGDSVRGVCVSIEESGCNNGMIYTVEYVSSLPSECLEIPCGDTHSVFVDLDWHDALNKASLDSKGTHSIKDLTVINPNESGSCNCGANFTL